MSKWPSDLLRSTGKASRKHDEGGRSYRTPYGFLPSVTTIREKTKSEASQLKLVNWSKKNPGAKEEASIRGTHIHYCSEMHVTGQPYEVDPKYEEYWTGMPEVLDQFSRVIWAERPLNGDFSYCIGADDIARVWGSEVDPETGVIRGWAGAPDLIGVAGGLTTLADYKTSNSPYCRYFPSKDIKESNPDLFREQMLGWMKYKSCCIQLAAYGIAIKETLGIEIDQAAVIACTPKLDKPQIFKLSRKKLDYLEQDWINLVRKYYAMFDHPNQDEPEDAVLETVPMAA